MIWYLLYPFRGTTDPPVLAPTHPLRKGFTDYGREAARHPVITLLISVALSSMLIYPFPFLYTNNFINGTSNLPHHVWTAAQPYEGDVDTNADIVMRSIWVHGSYMKALEPSILLTALDIQDSLLGPTLNFNPTKVRSNSFDPDDVPSEFTTEVRDSFHASNGLSNQTWFFHSPLLYWSGSHQAIEEDRDIISTINEGSRRSTAVNVTLRHRIVFSGKRFEDNRLVAADALVITLIHKLDSPVGHQWENRAAALAETHNERWKMYPADGRPSASRLYEFKFQPLSLQDDLLLGLAYTLTVIYFLLSLTRLRAMKSRIGLTVTVITHILLSILSSFTICGIFKIDLSKIPREAYPLVVLTIGLENMFRLINAVIVTPSENPTASRIAEALGQTGHIALAGAAQNLFILWLLYKVVSPGVGAFCIFAAIALVFDLFYLLTFFISVLSVDVRRTELSDSLNRARRRPGVKTPSAEKNTWVDALLNGDLPASTRIAGTVVMIGFVLIAQWHFFESEHPLRTILRIGSMIWAGKKSVPNPTSQLFVDLNQARTPAAWLQLQDHETAHEVIQVIKPNAHSCVARVYDPLVFVLTGSDRTSSSKGIRPFLPAVYDFVKHQSSTFLLTVIFLVAAVSLLMNYLLWDEDDRNQDKDDDYTQEKPLLAAKTLANGHALDIAMISASPDGTIVSVGLDRRIVVWDMRNGSGAYVVNTQHAPSTLFPIIDITIDDHARWIAIVSANGHVFLWDIRGRTWGPSTQVEMKPRKPVALFFKSSRTLGIPQLVLVQPSGLMTDITFKPDFSEESSQLQICKSPLVCVREFCGKSTTTNSQPVLCLATASRRGCVHIASELTSGWLSEGIEIDWPDDGKGVMAVLPAPALSAFIAVRQDAVDLVGLEHQAVLHTFETVGADPNSVRSFHSSIRRLQCGSGGLASFSIAFTHRDSGECTLDNYRPAKSGVFLCLGRQTCQNAGCCSWDEMVRDTQTVRFPGNWDVLPIGVVIGVRKRQVRPNSRDSHGPPIGDAMMRRRTSPLTRNPKEPQFAEDDIWEAWMLSAKGEKKIASLSSDDNNNMLQLLATSSGPLVQIGERSIAVGLGNVVKVITVGHERFDGVENGNMDFGFPTLSRRKKSAGGKRSCVLDA